MRLFINRKLWLLRALQGAVIAYNRRVAARLTREAARMSPFSLYLVECALSVLLSVAVVIIAVSCGSFGVS